MEDKTVRCSNQRHIRSLEKVTRILQHLEGIPHWLGLGSAPTAPATFLLFLHRPYTREEARISRYNYSAIVHLRNAMNVLDLHHQLTSTGNVFKAFLLK